MHELRPGKAFTFGYGPESSVVLESNHVDVRYEHAKLVCCDDGITLYNCSRKQNFKCTSEGRSVKVKPGDFLELGARKWHVSMAPGVSYAIHAVRSEDVVEEDTTTHDLVMNVESLSKREASENGRNRKTVRLQSESEEEYAATRTSRSRKMVTRSQLSEEDANVPALVISKPRRKKVDKVASPDQDEITTATKPLKHPRRKQTTELSSEKEGSDPASANLRRRQQKAVRFPSSEYDKTTSHEASQIRTEEEVR